MAEKRLRAVVSEEAYAVCARVSPGEDGYRSDEIATGIAISENLRARGFRPQLDLEDQPVTVRIPLGDAEDEAFEEAAGNLLEAVTW